MMQQTDSECRMCYKADENMTHSCVGCTIHAPSEYTNRHFKVAGYIHWTIRNLMGLQTTDKYCEYILEKVINFKGTAIVLDVPVIRDRTILANRPDIILHDKKEKTCLLTDIAIAGDSNVNRKQTEKLSK
jgi:hypothetical protein